MSDESLYEKPRTVNDIRDCIFYHTMDIPGYGHVEGEYDLRGNEHQYLGGVDFRRKRVLEIGTASGYLCFHMEKQGAEVIAFDLSENYAWDLVPFAGFDVDGLMGEYKRGLRKLNNGFWLCHRVFNSSAKVVYGTVYNIPSGIGVVDITTFCATLCHFQNPFAALQIALPMTREKVIVTDVIWNRFLPFCVTGLWSRPQMVFVPEYKDFKHRDAWWFLPPALVRDFLGVLGFKHTTVKYFFQKYKGRRRLAYSVVGTRT